MKATENLTLNDALISPLCGDGNIAEFFSELKNVKVSSRKYFFVINYYGFQFK